MMREEKNKILFAQDDKGAECKTESTMLCKEIIMVSCGATSEKGIM